MAAWLVLACSPLMAAKAQGQAQACGRLCFLDAHNHALDPASAALRVSGYVTNGPTLPKPNGYDNVSLASSDFRVQVEDPNPPVGAFAVLESRTRSGALRGSLRVPLSRPPGKVPLRSGFVRLVADETDARARGVETRVLLVALRDQVVLRYTGSRGRQSVSLRVGKPGNADDPQAARGARVTMHVLRSGPGTLPVIGHDDSDALALMRRQLAEANEIWLQCDLTFGDPAEAAIELVPPPPPCLLAVANEDGLPARGGGEIRFRVGGRSIGPIATRAGAKPLDTALDIARELRARGFYAEDSENLATRSGAGASADVIVRGSDGSLAHIETEPHAKLSTDARQSVQIGAVDLGDGIQEFDNMTAQVGSLEERTLIKALADDDPSSIDLFIINQFTGATRQGEAFIADPAGAITNVVVIDRNGLKHAPLAWTLAHELGHVLMDDPLHPDNIGPDRPWLLMDADSGRGTVDGPKRLRDQDCQRMREAAKRARAPLLYPYDSQ
jgi:hypothetical protein